MTNVLDCGEIYHPNFPMIFVISLIDFEFLAGMLIQQNVLTGAIVFTKVHGLSDFTSSWTFAKTTTPIIFRGSVPLLSTNYITLDYVSM